MTMIKCEQCQHALSEQATVCVNCGHPIQVAELNTNSSWSSVSQSKTPINIFAIAMMSCASILGVSATQIDSPHALTAFTYTLHIFLAVTGMFFITILFCRKAIYHPDYLVKAKRAKLELGNDNPVVAALLIAVMIIIYGLYHYS